MEPLTVRVPHDGGGTRIGVDGREDESASSRLDQAIAPRRGATNAGLVVDGVADMFGLAKSWAEADGSVAVQEQARAEGTAVAGTTTAGATRDGVVGIWYGKAPGLDRATDALRHGNLMGSHPKGGALVLVGDDPAAKSSTLPCVSDSALADLNIPYLYPADSQDVLDLGRHGGDLRRSAGESHNSWIERLRVFRQHIRCVALGIHGNEDRLHLGGVGA